MSASKLVLSQPRSVKDLAKGLGFEEQSQMRPVKTLTNETQAWAKRHMICDKMGGKTLGIWKSPIVRGHLKGMAESFVEERGPYLWPLSGLLRSELIYPNDKEM